MLTLLAAAALLAFVGAAALPWTIHLAPAAHLHLALAFGVMPLIMAAMVHFIPVLSRTGTPGQRVSLLPWLGSGAGLLAFLAFAIPSPNGRELELAALLGLVAAIGLGGWVYRRGAASLGKPHPCLYWYLAALACLGLALAAVPAMARWPQQRDALELFHLHLNTLGFVGMTALSTLQVLLPTAAGSPDGGAYRRLREDLKWAFGGSLLVAAGAAWAHPLAWLGAFLWSIPVARAARGWLPLYRHEIFRLDGATPSLAAALAGLGAAIPFGVAHGAGLLSATDTAHSYILAFLFPLVTGAIGQLLPVWLRPGPQNSWHGQFRHALVRWGGLRGLLFLGGGIALGLGWRWGFLPAGAALILFLGQLGRSVAGWRSSSGHP